MLQRTLALCLLGASLVLLTIGTGSTAETGNVRSRRLAPNMWMTFDTLVRTPDMCQRKVDCGAMGQRICDPEKHKLSLETRVPGERDPRPLPMHTCSSYQDCCPSTKAGFWYCCVPKIRG